MICKHTQNTIDTLLRLKVDNEDKPTINLIGSYPDSIPGVSVYKSKSKSVGELAEFIGLLKSYIHY